MYAVYGLINPLTHQMFYVGMTKDMYTRYIQHLNMEGNNKAKNEIVLSLKERHIVPEIWTLAIAQTVEEAKRLEAFHIDKQRLLQQPLANQTLWTGYTQEALEKEELELIAEQIYQVRTAKPLKGPLGFIYRWLEPYLIGKVLYDNRYAHEQISDVLDKLSTAEEWTKIKKRLRNGEDPAKIVKSYGLPYGRATQELSAVVQMMSQQIDEEIAEQEEEL